MRWATNVYTPRTLTENKARRAALFNDVAYPTAIQAHRIRFVSIDNAALRGGLADTCEGDCVKTTTFGIHRKWIVGVVGVLGAVASSLSLAFPFVIKLLPGTTHIASTIRENNAFASHPALTATSPAAYSGFAAATGLKGLAATVKLGNETMPINVAERRGLIRFTDSSIENLDPRSVP